jgi:threonine aldolase
MDPHFDLRSDTVTRPTEGMRAAMATAEVGDDVFRDDPTVLRLERRVAELVGTEAALFVPTGTMANQLAMLCHCQRGDEVVAGWGAHCVEYESGAIAAWSGAQTRLVGTAGPFTVADVERALPPVELHRPRSRVLALENTHNMSGGRLFPQADVDALVVWAGAHGLRRHLDGARLWNAAAATGMAVARLARGFDTVSVCFSKGLGAPLGSALCGRVETIERALRFRKMLGGAMRQAGIAAAGALYALEHHRERLVEDHEAARALALEIGGLAGVEVRTPETNMVLVDLPCDADRVVAAALARGVRLAATGPRRLRLVTHLDVVGPRWNEVVAAVVASLRDALPGGQG